MALPSAQAAETSAAAASALKVLSTPLNGAYSNSAPSGNSPSAPAAAGQVITVQKGESIDAVLRRGLPGMPLKDEFLRQALAKANPKIFPKGTTYPVRPGTVLALPSVEALRQHILAQSPQAAALFQAPAAKEDAEETNPGPDKRRWVRFP
jgi:Tfp pilus assembly protein FimV